MRSLISKLIRINVLHGPARIVDIRGHQCCWNTTQTCFLNASQKHAQVIRALPPSSHFDQRWCDCDGSFLLFKTFTLKERIPCSFPRRLQITDEEYQQVFPSQNDCERLCVGAFCGFSVELYWQIFALKTLLGVRRLLSPSHISVVARY